MERMIAGPGSTDQRQATGRPGGGAKRPRRGAGCGGLRDPRPALLRRGPGENPGPFRQVPVVPAWNAPRHPV